LLSIELLPGQNVLTAHVFNSTDDEGPVSAAITVNYAAASPPNNGPTRQTAPPLLARTQFIYKGFHISDTVEWPIEISGGVAPYAVDVDWGDGSHNLYSRGHEGVFNISHKYSKAGGYKNSYIIKVNLSDSVGGHSFLQFFVIIADRATGGVTANIFSKPPPTVANNNWLWIAWPAYIFVLLMAISYWLGEREEIIVLRKRGLLKRKR